MLYVDLSAQVDRNTHSYFQFLEKKDNQGRGVTPITLLVAGGVIPYSPNFPLNISYKS